MKKRSKKEETKLQEEIKKYQNLPRKAAKKSKIEKNFFAIRKTDIRVHFKEIYAILYIE